MLIITLIQIRPREFNLPIEGKEVNVGQAILHLQWAFFFVTSIYGLCPAEVAPHALSILCERNMILPNKQLYPNTVLITVRTTFFFAVAKITLLFVGITYFSRYLGVHQEMRVQLLGLLFRQDDAQLR